MLKSILSSLTAERLSVYFVCIVGAVIGSYAHQGMNTAQWAGAAVAVLGAVTLATLVHTWPSAKKADAATQ